MDVPKAFDRVTQWTLFKKLILRGVTLIVIRLIVYFSGENNNLYLSSHPIIYQSAYRMHMGQYRL